MPRSRRCSAAYVLSMVFKICRPKLPRAGMPIRERPCLEHMQQLGVRVGQPLASVLSMVFIHQPPLPQEDELSWFFWIVVFLSVWVIYTTSA